MLYGEYLLLIKTKSQSSHVQPVNDISSWRDKSKWIFSMHRSKILLPTHVVDDRLLKCLMSSQAYSGWVNRKVNMVTQSSQNIPSAVSFSLWKISQVRLSPFQSACFIHMLQVLCGTNYWQVFIYMYIISCIKCYIKSLT